MSKFLFLLFSFVPLMAYANYVPNKNDKAYTLIVETGAKLLELDLVRKNINAQEKSIIAYVEQEHFTSSAGKAINALLPLENLAPSFDKAVPVFMALQESVNTAQDMLAVQRALKGLIAMLDAPEVFHAVLPSPHLIKTGYQDALSYAPIVEFINALRQIVHREFLMHYCDESKNIITTHELVPGAYLFYQIIKQAIVNVFGNLLKPVYAAPMYNDATKVGSTIPVDKTFAESGHEKAKHETVEILSIEETEKIAKEEELRREEESMTPQDRLHKAILNDSAEGVKIAVLAGADVNFKKDGKAPVLLSVLLKRLKALKGLLELHAHANINHEGSPIILIAMQLESIEAAVLLAKHGASLSGLDTQKKNVMSYAYEFLQDPKSRINKNLVLELILMNYKLHGLSNDHQEHQKNRLWHIAMNLSDSVINFELFLKNGANPNEVIPFVAGYETPLLLAIKLNKIKIVKSLLAAGANINQKACPIQGNYTELTPLSYAILLNRDAIVELLVEQGNAL